MSDVKISKQETHFSELLCEFLHVNEKLQQKQIKKNIYIYERKK